MADQSSIPAIREYALKAAAEERKRLARLEARLSSPAAVSLCIGVWTIGLALSLYAARQYYLKAPLLFGEIVALVFTVCIILTLIFLTSAKLIQGKILADFLQSVWKWITRSKQD